MAAGTILRAALLTAAVAAGQVAGCDGRKDGSVEPTTRPGVGEQQPGNPGARRTAVFAAGCFWGVEAAFRQVDGVVDVAAGYTGGHVDNPTYKDVCTGRTGHAEAVRVLFDPSRVSYEQLLRRFFETHDPTQLNRQGPDVGAQYRSAVFCFDARQKEVAERLVAELRANGYDVVTEVLPACTFFPAGEYHQNYLEKHPERQTCHVRVPRFDARGGQ